MPGTLVAVPSGFAVVLAMTGGSQNALVGVAIAAALLPPVVNAGLCFALAFWWQVCLNLSTSLTLTRTRTLNRTRTLS
jgi:uncharacterized membrane protein